MRPFAGFSFRSVCRAAAMGLLMATALTASASGAGSQVAAGRVPQPIIESARGDKCVQDPVFMRRNHMELLKHQRDDTVHGGIRGAKYSLNGCIGCHASQTTGSVATASTNFCQSCHVYAAVKIDCFECHSSKPARTAAHSPSPQEKPAQTAVAPQVQGVALQKQVKP
ncbi:MAG: hypothetical protein HGA21_00295 [Burkholderiaceae bacterium]|nr:hypothetical protein [Burkholderiaceae bacterium]